MVGTRYSLLLYESTRNVKFTNIVFYMNKKSTIDLNELIHLYIDCEYTSKKCANHFNCCSKTIRNRLHAAGVPVRQNAEAVKLERSKWSSEKELKRTLCVMNTWRNMSDEKKREIARKKALSDKINSPEAVKKANQTKRRNGTYKRSKSEDLFYKKLCCVFGVENVVRQFTSDLYPFACDFYIRSKNLYIEYQGHYTHGSKPYCCCNDIERSCISEAFESHKTDTTTWSVRDTNKISSAISGGIMLLLIYPKNDCYLVQNYEIKNIGKFNIVDANDIN